MNRSNTETQLLLKVQTERSADAYGALYDLYIDAIYRFVYFKVRTVEDAEELTADVFMKAWEHLMSEQKEPVRSFRPFIYQIARNTIVDWYRKKSTTSEIPSEIEQFDVPFEDSTIESVDVKLSYKVLEGYMQSLKEEYQEVILLKYIEELNTAEIAAVLGKKKTAVRVLLHRAMKTLSQIVNTANQ